MKKMSTVFVIDRSVTPNQITSEVRPENQWVLDGEGIASIKVDGTSCYFVNGKLYKRYTRRLKKQFFKQSKKAGFVATEDMFMDIPSDDYIACNDTFDPVTLHWPYWIAVEDTKNDKFHWKAWQNQKESLVEDQTYELIGDSIQGNKYGYKKGEVRLIAHGHIVVNVERSIDAMLAMILDLGVEGLVFKHEDGRMAKLRYSDFYPDAEWSEHVAVKE